MNLSLTLEYFRHFREIGSLVPDSKTCCRALLEPVPFDSARVIYEYGAGSGRVTRELLRRKRPETALVAFEKNLQLYRRLADGIREENFILVNADILERDSASAGEGHPARADCVVSTLPCSSLDFERLVQSSVIPRLAPGGIYIQYAHTLSCLKGFRARSVLGRYFREVRSVLVWRNLPPALVYTCRFPRRLDQQGAEG
ncbi:MAG: hypothetical protein P9M08_09825 [Candidatus Erginobacter occultus]|nr:hypothetical protein [Candidatus Erginobacter occultus]